MAELRVTSTGTIKLFESDDTSSSNNYCVLKSLGGDRTITLPDANVDLTEVNTMPIANLDIDAGTDIGDIVDADLFIIDDGAGGTNRKVAASRINHTNAGVSSALDDITTGDAASTLATSAGDITIDAQGNDTDIVFKGTDGGADTTFWEMDGERKKVLCYQVVLQQEFI